jgi:predicted ribosomally synthesized peptide with SipW-like signal peptide
VTPGGPRRRMLRAGVLVGLVVLLAGGAGFGAGSVVQPTSASWTDTEVTTGTATTRTIVAPTKLTCVAPSGLLANQISYTWTAPVGSTPTSYTFAWAGSAGTGAFTVPAGTTTASITAGSLVSLGGTSMVAVSANYGSWTSAQAPNASFATLSLLGAVVSWTCTNGA